MILKNPKIEVNFQGKNLESFSLDKDNFKFPFLAHIANDLDFNKQITLKLTDEGVEIG